MPSQFPALFSESNVESTGGRRTAPSRLNLAREYLDLEEQVRACDDVNTADNTVRRAEPY